MDLETLNKANAVQSMIEELEKHISQIQNARLDEDLGEYIKFGIFSGVNRITLRHEFLPLIPDQFFHDYLNYAKTELEELKQELKLI